MNGSCPVCAGTALRQSLTLHTAAAPRWARWTRATVVATPWPCRCTCRASRGTIEAGSMTGATVEFVVDINPRMQGHHVSDHGLPIAALEQLNLALMHGVFSQREGKS